MAEDGFRTLRVMLNRNVSSRELTLGCKECDNLVERDTDKLGRRIGR